jgi:hypothetical protein
MKNRNEWKKKIKAHKTFALLSGMILISLLVLSTFKMNILPRTDGPLQLASDTPSGFHLGDAIGGSNNGIVLEFDPNNNGGWTTTIPAGGIPADCSVRLKVNWWLEDDAITPGQTVVIENIPSVFKIPEAGMSGTLKNASNISFGTWSVDAVTRKVMLTFNDNVNVYSLIKGSFILNFKVEVIEDDTEIVIDLGEYGDGDITVPIIPDDKENITKKGLHYDQQSKILTWEILVNEGNKALTNVKIIDILGSNLQYLSSEVYKKPKGASDWTKLNASQYQESVTSSQITWNIGNTTNRDAYRVIVKTKTTGPSETVHFTNLAKMESDELEDVVEDTEFDIVQDLKLIKKQVENANGTKKVEYYKDGDTNGTPTGSATDCDYILLYWDIQTYFKNAGDTITDTLNATPTTSVAHTFVEDSLTITGKNFGSIGKAFSNADGAFGNKTMTLTGTNGAPKAASTDGLYHITYTTKISKKAGISKNDTISYSNVAHQNTINSDSGSGGGTLPNPNMPGFSKTKYMSDGSKRQTQWHLTFNTQHKTVTNPQFHDSYIVYKEDIDRLFDWNNVNGTGNAPKLQVYKWFYFARNVIELQVDEFSDWSIQGNYAILVEGVDYEVVYHKIKDEHMLLPDGTELYSGQDYESGFTIKFLGDRATQPNNKAYRVTFKTQEHTELGRGYKSTWDKQPGDAGYDPNEIFNHDRFYSATNLWPDLTFFNYAKATWDEGTQDSLGSDAFGNWEQWMKTKSNKRVEFKNPYEAVIPSGAWSMFQVFKATNDTSSHITNSNLNGVDDQTALGYPTYFDRAVGLFRLEFNALGSLLPAGTKIIDDLSQMGSDWQYSQGTARLFAGLYGGNGWGQDSTKTQWYHQQSDILALYYGVNSPSGWNQENYPRFTEGVHYSLSYNVETKKLEYTLLQDWNKPLVAFLVAEYKGNLNLGDNLVAGSYKNTAKLTRPGGGEENVKVEGDYGKSDYLVKKSGIAGENDERGHISYSVMINEAGANYKQMLFRDHLQQPLSSTQSDLWTSDHASFYLDTNGNILRDTADVKNNGKVGVKVTKMHWNQALNQWERGELMQDGVDYQLLPYNQVGFLEKTAPHADERVFFKYAAKQGADIPVPYWLVTGHSPNYYRRLWNGNCSVPNAGSLGDTDVERESNDYFVDLNGRGKSASQMNFAYDSFAEVNQAKGIYKRYIMTYNDKPSTMNYDFFTILFGPEMETDEVHNDTFLIEYVTYTDTIRTDRNVGTVEIRNNEVTKGNNDSKTTSIIAQGEANGFNHPLTIQKTDNQGNILDGSKILLEKRMGASNWQSAMPSAVGEKTIAGGNVTINGFTNGLYRITELLAPSGYLTLSSPIYFKWQFTSGTLGSGDLIETNSTGAAMDDPRVDIQFENGVFILKFKNEHKPFLLEKTWVFNSDNPVVMEDLLGNLEVKVNFVREKKNALGQWSLDTTFATRQYTLNSGNNFKQSITDLEDLGADYRYVAKEADIINTLNNKSVLVYFETKSGEEGDGFDTENRIVTDENGNWHIIVVNDDVPVLPMSYVYVGFKKEFEFAQSTIESIEEVHFKLYRKSSKAGANYEFIQNITLTPAMTVSPPITLDPLSLQYISGRLNEKDAEGNTFDYFIKETGVIDGEGNEVLGHFESDAKDYMQLTTFEMKPADSTVDGFGVVTNVEEKGGELPATGGPGVKHYLALTLLFLSSVIFLTYRFLFKKSAFKI